MDGWRPSESASWAILSQSSLYPARLVVWAVTTLAHATSFAITRLVRGSVGPTATRPICLTITNNFADAMSSSRPSSQGESQVVKDFKQWLETNDKGQAVAVGAIHALTNLVKRSDASTIMELEILLKDAQEQLQKAIEAN